ncbi:HERV-H LTR-associating protein 2 [Suncus etruscus]|uniref:HERV-H LTR-associating protein 2 n=1 Tax=Suncus etruscus TaxID=109475 RepID=UPI0021107A57|nr:HERV-H LTR-associating protein 2 [Suncus etruscus]
MKAALAVWIFFLIVLSRSDDVLFPRFFGRSRSQKVQRVTGKLGADIILPCSFKVGSEPVIYWRDLNTEVIHSFFKNNDQIINPQYINRTSLFHSEIHKGNASLLLKRLNFLDEGLYTCYVGTSSGNFWGKVELKVGGFMTPMIEYEEINTSSNLICGVLCVQPCPNITWKIDDIPISGHTNMEENGTLSHYVNKINIESPGSFYECSIENSLLEQTWTGLWIQKGGLDKVESEEVSFLCELGNNLFKPDEDFIVTWSREQNGIFSMLASFHSSSQRTIINETRISCNEELMCQGTIFSTLTKLSISDSGKYLCNISSSKYILLTTQNLDVEMHNDDKAEETKALQENGADK